MERSDQEVARVIRLGPMRAQSQRVPYRIDGTNPATPNNIKHRVKNSAPAGGLIDWTENNTTIAVSLPPSVTAGSLMTVTVQFGYRLLTPIIAPMLPGQTLTLTARSSAVIVRVPDCTANPCR